MIGDPETERKAGTVCETDFTVLSHDRVVPLEVKTCPTVPTAVRPVPPLVVGRAVPERVIARVPLVVIGDPETERKAGTVCETEVTVPNPKVPGVCHDNSFPGPKDTSI